MNYTRVRELDDPTRPWRRVYRAGDRFVKVHVRRQDRPFGEVGFTLSGSLCGGDGKALTGVDDEPLILSPRLAHEIVVHAESADDVQARVEEGVALIVGRVLFAADHDAAA